MLGVPFYVMRRFPVITVSDGLPGTWTGHADDVAS
jgi:hypothetical protein